MAVSMLVNQVYIHLKPVFITVLDILLSCLGISTMELEGLAHPDSHSIKTSRRDLPYVLSQVWLIT